MTTPTTEETATGFLQLARELPSRVQTLRTAHAAWLALNLKSIPWESMRQLADGSYTFPYPLYPTEIWRLYEALGALVVGPTTPGGSWVPAAEASLGQLLDQVLGVYRAERFNDGVIASFVQSGEFDTAVERIIAALPTGSDTEPADSSAQS